MKFIIASVVIGLVGFRLAAQVAFTNSPLPAVANNPFWVTAADVNGDGKVDLICSEYSANTLTVLTNNGSGAFTVASILAVGSTPISVTAANINGHGNIDLVSANFGDSTLSVLTNSGTGVFTHSATLSVGRNPHSVISVDVNGDGYADLICANFGDNTVSVLTNNGAGQFVLSSSPAVGANPFRVTAADVNGDGKIDLITANYGDNSLTVLTNNGKGGFLFSATLAAGSNPEDVAAADLNGDGKIDLVAANLHSSNLTVYTNTGTGEFLLASTLAVGNDPASVATADVNGDGSMDLITANYGDNTLTILTNNGVGGFFTALTPATGNGPNDVTAADVNGDGKIDLISANYLASSLTLLTNATPEAPFITSQPEAQTNVLGGSAYFNVVANDGPSGSTNSLSYQWYFDNAPINNATNNFLSITNIQQANIGDYFVVVSSLPSVTRSQIASLYELPTILTEPTNQVVGFEAPATFSVSAIGYPAVNAYQWFFNGTNLPGANSNTFTIGRVTLADTGNYQVLVGSPVGSTLSAIATLDVSPSITVPFAGATPIWGQAATLSVGAIGNGTLSYQWYFNGAPIAGATGPGLSFSSIQFTNAGFYNVVITSPYGSVTNVAAQVAVNPAALALSFSPTLTITGAAGDSYLIQRSADLTSTNNWMTLTNLTLTQQQQIWVDTSVDASSPFNSKYFYQLIPIY